MGDQSEIQRDRDYLRVVIDDGSGYLKVEAQHVRPGESLHEVPTDRIQLQEGEDKIRQKYIIDGDMLHCGEIEVANWLQEHPTEARRVIELSKLAMCPEYSNAPATTRFFNAIGACCHGQIGDIHDFKLWVYKWIRNRICAWYRDLSPKGHNYEGQYWEVIQIETTITVPAMWDDHQCGIIRNAAKEAGFLNLRLRLEPLCAAAREMRLLKERGYLKNHDSFLWHDIGHATIDFALVRIEESSVVGQPPDLVVVGKPHGSLLGSHVIHDLAWNYIKTCFEVEEYGGLQSCLRLLGGMSEAEFVRQVTERIEEEKRRSPCRPFTISINAMDGWWDVPEGMKFLDIRVSKQEIESWLDAWTQMLVDAQTTYIETFGPNVVGGIVITGGGGANKVAFAGLKKAASSMNIRLISSDDSDNPVAKGGLSLYPTNEPDTLPVGCWYVVRAEEFDYTRHPDAIKKAKGVPQWKRRDGFKHPVLNDRLTTPSISDDGSFEAIDRLALIARTMDVGGNVEAVETPCVTYSFPIEAEWNPRLEFDIYFSEKHEPNGKPLLDKHGNIRPGFKRMQMQLADLSEADWESHASALEFYQYDGKQWFVLDGFIEMTTKKDHWDLHVTILEPGEALRFEDAGETPSKRQKTASRRQKHAADQKFDAKYNYRTLFKTKRSIWDKFCSHSIKNVHVAAPGCEEVTTAKRKPRTKRHVGTPLSAVTRSGGLQAMNGMMVGPATCSEENVIAATPMASNARAAIPDGSASSPSSEKAPSNRRGVKCDNTSRQRMLHDRFAWVAERSATPLPSTLHGINQSNGLTTPPFSAEKSQSLGRSEASMRQSSAVSRLEALRNRPPGSTAEDVFRSCGVLGE